MGCASRLSRGNEAVEEEGCIRLLGAYRSPFVRSRTTFMLKEASGMLGRIHQNSSMRCSGRKLSIRLMSRHSSIVRYNASSLLVVRGASVLVTTLDLRARVVLIHSDDKRYTLRLEYCRYFVPVRHDLATDALIIYMFSTPGPWLGQHIPALELGTKRGTTRRWRQTLSIAVNGLSLTQTMRCSRQESLSVGYTAHRTRRSQFSEGKH